ncbi:3-oxoadipate enol-lactonase [Planosporangium mesophilum]|uniref:3-oxoadipate enol-lactonase n=1 Tax=Planosporangium mesophilum TaxID=689768 RepID=A0A8J3TCE5_9ACTN|nr:3-oxoadipate enol-lactonase [Planosporangium mesophilum]NJC86279.1 3-oxoadipate enol-lactonase [Planosporangium mesophilum]GII23312.1 3-oxoadipate enol-lactonase [Planosporangium mesophilum]
MDTGNRTARLNYRVDGPDDAPVVVFGPSLGTDLGLFEPQAAALAGRYRVIRHDLRGHGGSEVPAGPYTIGELAGDVIALLDSLGVQRFSYCGVSIGGAIGQWLGVHHADRLDALVICASAARFADPESWPVRAAKVRAEGTEFLVPSRTGAWFTPGFAAREPERAEWLLGMLRTTPPEGYAGCCEAIGVFDVRDRLAGITAPTLVLAGSEDPATPVDMVRQIADGIPGARFQVVEDASHLLNVEKPEIANAAIAEHLAAITRTE